VVPRFAPDPIVLKVGEPVQFKVTSTNIRHTFTIEALDIDVEIPQTKETITTKAVTPQEAGEFLVICRIHRRLPMEGKIVITR
jgi:plastocyanin